MKKAVKETEERGGWETARNGRKSKGGWKRNMGKGGKERGTGMKSLREP